MKEEKLFFATNRNHKGDNRWSPNGYGKRFSGDGHENLRFGELTIEADDPTVQKSLNKKYRRGRVGDGEKLSKYLTKRAKEAKITAYEDNTSEATEEIAPDKNPSTRFFLNLKKEMMGSADVMIYIHGYNVCWEAAVGGALALQFMLNSHRQADDKKVIVVLFSWPSDGSMMPFAAYRSDRCDARDSGRAVGRAFLKLRQFLATLRVEAKNDREKLCEHDLHLLCHSMGNYVLQKSLESKLIGYSGGSALPRMFKHIFLCAPDVNDDALEGNNGLSRLHELASNVTIYYNQEDRALAISQHTKNHQERLGGAGNAHPALVHNKVHQVDCSDIVRGFVEHGYYLWATVNKDIWQSISAMSFDHTKRNRKTTSQNREWVML